MQRTPTSPSAKLMVAALCAATLAVAPVPTYRAAQAATPAGVQLVTNGGFESGPQQSAWLETQSSGAELIDVIDPHSGAWAADLCNIDNCTDGHGNGGDTLTQPLLVPGQVVSAQLSFFYNVATSEPDLNTSCKDWLSVGLGVGRTPDATATRRYCASTSAQYRSDTIDVTAFLGSQGGRTVDLQLAGFTNGLNPSEFFVDDVSLAITYLVTPSAPVVSAITDCSTGQATLTWTPPQFPVGTQWPVQSYVVTPYSVSGVAQQSTTVPGSQTALAVNLAAGSVCYFTVTAINVNGTGRPGSPGVPITSVTPLSTPQSTGFTLQWALQPASATATFYTVLIRDGSGPWLTWGSTPSTSTTVYGTPGHTYRYYVQASNAAGSGPPPTGAGEAGVTVPTSAARVTGFNGLYGVDAFGRLHPAGSPPLLSPTLWNWRIARGVAVRTSGLGGYTVDGFGGIHPFGDAGPVSGGVYWNGWDIVRGLALRPDGASGYVLDGFGGVHPFGGAPAVTTSGYWPGWDVARAIVLNASGAGGYVLDAFGGIHQFGAAKPLNGTAYWSGWDIARGIALRADGTGGYVLDGFGGVHPFGAAPALAVSAYWAGWDIARGLALLGNGSGGYVVDGYGGFHPFGALSYGPGTPNYTGSDVMRGLGGA